MAEAYPYEDPIIFDLEVFPGWWMAGFEYRGEKYLYQGHPRQEMIEFIRGFQAAGLPAVGFNSRHYDDPVLTGGMLGQDPYDISVDIIQNDAPPWKYANDIYSIDLMKVLPGRMSLKKLGICLGWKKLQELPIPFDKEPTEEDKQVILKSYNPNDLDLTRLLYEHLKPELALRSQISEVYQTDVRSVGRATMAEIILLHELEKKLGQPVKKRDLNDLGKLYLAEAGNQVRVYRPKWWDQVVKGKLPIVEELAEGIFATPIPVGYDGYLDKKAFSAAPLIGDRFFKMGVGGLHSIDGPGAWVPEGEQKLVDIDVTGYYPNLIINNGLSPRSWGPIFLEIFTDLVTRRTTAKRAGEKLMAEVLKIATNGTFGKTSDVFSSVYDPELMANTTVVGQLSLLVLIEMFSEVEGIRTVSANTDGLTVLLDDALAETLMQQIVIFWESQTGLTMEYTEYSGLYQRDVNSYIATKPDGSLKAKGYLINKWPDLEHLPVGNIVKTAIHEYLAKGTAIEDTIFDCQDLNQFIYAHVATGQTKCYWKGEEQGKIVRWYNCLEGSPITKVYADGREQQVPRSESARSVPDLPEEFPWDIAHSSYIDQARELLSTISRRKVPGMNQKAAKLHARGLTPAIVDTSKERASKAGSTWGKVDFCSLGEGEVLGIKTGNGVVAKVWEDGRPTELIWTGTAEYPAKTRPLVTKREGFTIYNGARVAYDSDKPAWITTEDLDLWFTPGELKKVRESKNVF